MTSKYWDDFERRAKETVECLRLNHPIPVRRVAIFITNKCNFKCSYCNHVRSLKTIEHERFFQLFAQYGKDCIYHITGGEPSTVNWLYPAIRMLKTKGYTINLNTNAYIMPPADCVSRLKVSLDDFAADSWDKLVGVQGAFNKVCKNIKKASKLCDLSITYTLSKENYRKAPMFAWWSLREFPDQYATFFSIYKGTDPRFAWDDASAEDFWTNVHPYIEVNLGDTESGKLFAETCTDKRRVVQGNRFPENMDLEKPCFLSFSERVVSPAGKIYNCSHLYRDGIYTNSGHKHEKCRYGCNLRLVKFNEEVERRLYNGKGSNN